ncbi:hypothetical protein HYT52_00490 [Candidatus Woesearchaeota archaeon]|nr:hypothetical protein [Candidatus Woesearchaeota archaeon]
MRYSALCLAGYLAFVSSSYAQAPLVQPSSEVPPTISLTLDQKIDEGLIVLAQKIKQCGKGGGEGRYELTNGKRFFQYVDEISLGDNNHLDNKGTVDRNRNFSGDGIIGEGDRITFNLGTVSWHAMIGESRSEDDGSKKRFFTALENALRYLGKLKPDCSWK